MTAQTTLVDPDRFGIPRGGTKMKAGLLAVACVVIAFVFMNAASEGLRAFAGLAWVGALISGLAAMALPSRRKRAQAEFARRLAQFRQEVQEVGQEGERRGLENLLSRPSQLGLVDAEVAPEIELIRATLEVFDLEEQVETTKRFPTIPGHERVIGSDACHFVAPAFVEKRGPDESGQLFLTNERVVFLGSTLMAFPWAKVAVVRRDGRDLFIQRNDRQTPYCFRVNSLSEAMRGHYIAANLSAQAPTVSP